MIAVSALILLLGACSARAPAPAGPTPDSVRTETLVRGVEYKYRWFANGPWAVHSLVIEPGACAVLQTVKGLDQMVGRERVTAMASRSVAAGIPVLAAINADFFSFDPPGVSEGPQISRGMLLKTEGRHREAIEDRLVRLQPVFAIGADGKPAVLLTRMRGTLQVGSVALPFAGVNVRARIDSAVVYTSFAGATTPVDSAALELVVENGVVVRVDSSADGVAIPARGGVIVARGHARNAASAVRVGAPATWAVSFEGVSNPREMIGGYPMLLLNGKAVHHDEAGLRTTFADRRHPRAVIGVDREGRVHIVAVDGRQPPYSEGMSLEELGEFMLAHGITDALNLDGGGSTTFVVRGQIANKPSDPNGERAVANALIVIEQASKGACARKR
jgi:hypothetical protein